MILEDVSLLLEPGKIIGVIGKSGEGKTTLLKSLAGRVSLASGEISFEGIPLLDPSEKLIPEYEENYPGWRLFLAQGLRGENQNKYGWIIIVESEEVRDKYYNDDGSITEFGQQAADNMKPVLQEAEEFGKLHRTYTDWLIL